MNLPPNWMQILPLVNLRGMKLTFSTVGCVPVNAKPRLMARNKSPKKCYRQIRQKCNFTFIIVEFATLTFALQPRFRVVCWPLMHAISSVQFIRAW
jgi:hypothetical protein